MSTRYVVVVAVLISGVIAGCSPERGSKEWCNQLKDKPQSQMTQNDAETFVNKCLFSSN